MILSGVIQIGVSFFFYHFHISPCHTQLLLLLYFYSSRLWYLTSDTGLYLWKKEAAASALVQLRIPHAALLAWRHYASSSEFPHNSTQTGKKSVLFWFLTFHILVRLTQLPSIQGPSNLHQAIQLICLLCDQYFQYFGKFILYRLKLSSVPVLLSDQLQLPLHHGWHVSHFNWWLISPSLMLVFAFWPHHSSTWRSSPITSSFFLFTEHPFGHWHLSADPPSDLRKLGCIGEVLSIHKFPTLHHVRKHLILVTIKQLTIARCLLYLTKLRTEIWKLLGTFFSPSIPMHHRYHLHTLRVSIVILALLLSLSSGAWLYVEFKPPGRITPAGHILTFSAYYHDYSLLSVVAQQLFPNGRWFVLHWPSLLVHFLFPPNGFHGFIINEVRRLLSKWYTNYDYNRGLSPFPCVTLSSYLPTFATPGRPTTQHYSPSTTLQSHIHRMGWTSSLIRSVLTLTWSITQLTLVWPHRRTSSIPCLNPSCLMALMIGITPSPACFLQLSARDYNGFQVYLWHLAASSQWLGLWCRSPNHTVNGNTTLRQSHPWTKIYHAWWLKWPTFSANMTA